MPLNRKDYEFNNTRILHIMPKHIELDRVLINLYMLLKYNGKRPVARTGRREVTVDYIVEHLVSQHAAKLHGFNVHQDVIRDWVYSDLVDVVYRGEPNKEKVAAPLPLHLNAYKLRNPKQAEDYRAAEQLFSMIRYAEPNLVDRLARYLGQGMDPGSYEVYDGKTPLDLDTLLIVRMVENPHLQESPSARSTSPEPPLCLCQSRLLCNDLRRLLAYENVIPRSVLVGYLRTAFGLHLGLHLLKLFHHLPGWVRDKEAHPGCLNCRVNPEGDHPFRVCPYAFQNPEAEVNKPVPELLVDMGEDYQRHMAQLSRENCARHYASMNDYIQAVFTVNQLFRYADSQQGRRYLQTQPETVREVLRILAHPPSNLDSYFFTRIDDTVPEEEVETERADIRAVRQMSDLAPLDRFVQIVALQKARYYRDFLTRQLDSVFMKNQDSGLLLQGKGKRNERRWHIGSRLLEMLVQIAVLEPVGQQTGATFHSHPILIDQFVVWLRERYGMTLMPTWPDATIEDNQAFNGNLGHLKTRLREIGFFTDLSDAYNTQTIRPRYTIGRQD